MPKKPDPYTMLVFSPGLDHPTPETIAYDHQPTLKEIQAKVHGYIETVPYFTKYGPYSRGHAYTNEEAKLRGLPPNPVATEAWKTSWRWPAGTPFNDILVGTVVIVFKGEPKPLSYALTDKIVNLYDSDTNDKEPHT